jgi:predicted transport protein
MSFHAYLDNIKAKTGKTPEDFKKLAAKKGLLAPGVKAGQIIAWLKEDFGLGHGHAMAIYAVLTFPSQPKLTTEESIAKHFVGGKAVWRESFDGLIKKLKKLGDDVSVATTSSYLSILRGGKKFAIVQITKDRMDIGIKLKTAKATKRFEPSGAWNAMVTHRVRITDPKQIDAEVLAWLKQAYNTV